MATFPPSGLSNAPVTLDQFAQTVPLPTSRRARNVSAQIDSELRGTSTPIQFPSDLPKYHTVLRVNKYHRQDLNTVGKLKHLGTIALPLPLNLIDIHQVGYRLDALTAFAGAGAAIGSTFGDAGATIGATIGGIAGGTFNYLGNLFSGGNKGKGSGVDFVTGGLNAGTNVAQAKYGYSPNEFVTVLFRGPMYKRHQLKFKLSPKNFQEAVAIRKIINRLNNAEAPTMVASGILFGFPAIFEIAYQPNPGYLFKFKPAVLENMAINYSAGGAPAFIHEPGSSAAGKIDGSNNVPESVDIQLSFLELEYWISENNWDLGNFKETNKPFDGFGVS